MACVTLFDVAREGLMHGAWRANGALAQAYAIFLLAHVGNREREKWNGTDTGASYHGQWFIAAWLALTFLLWFLDITNLARVSWPASLNQNLGWVLTACAGGKVSARGRAKKAGLIGQEPPDHLLTPDQLLTRHLLTAASIVFGLACLIDCATEGFTAAEWRFNGGLYGAWFMILGAHATTRAWEAWTDPVEQDGMWGLGVLLAWAGLTAALGIGWEMSPWVAWPANLNVTLATVVAVFTGGNVPVWVKTRKPGSSPAPAPPKKEDPEPGPEPDPEPGPKPEPGDAEGDKGRYGDVDFKTLTDACRRRGLFTREDIAGDFGLTADQAKGHIAILVKKGLVGVARKGLYRWIGD